MDLRTEIALLLIVFSLSVGQLGSFAAAAAREEEEGHPYLFNEEDFTTHIESEEGGIQILQSFVERSELLRGVEDYRVAILRANPRTFVLPVHFDAESILFVTHGRATIKLVRKNKLESVSVQHGDIIRISAGVPVYIINNEENEELWIVNLLKSVSVPGSVQAFYGAAGQNPETFYRAFSTELLEAALNSERRKWGGIFTEQKRGIVVKASPEQLEELSRRGGEEEEGNKESKKNKAFNLFKKDPSISNKYGRLHEADSDDYDRLRDVDVIVSYVNITKGSMAGPVYYSRGHKIAIVVRGEGYFEMACPHVSSRGSSQLHEGGGGKSEKELQKSKQKGAPTYQKIRGQLRPATVFVVPPDHPIAVVSSWSPSDGNKDQNLQILGFQVNAQGRVKYPLAGKGNIISCMEDEAKKLAFDSSSRKVDDVFGAQEEELFFRGPKQWREGNEGRADA
ncbi:vicilin Jug r 6.0101-like isoform X1 [Malania oleifera]|uniref:vicilin Jug r 6.0101-like isoform X1 n=1 Tax=Malania oleifera TaxID=397392 RepID=UPI0025ADF407|nr:vicilin Jug r 6.0101-like isoform X1 [Malania oleifera]